MGKAGDVPRHATFALMGRFTIRVYGLLAHEGRVLVADEVIRGQRVTKFPGGGLEYGEGTTDCLVREIREELGEEATDVRHFYTTDFFQRSAFHADNVQVLAIYYTFRVKDPGRIAVVVRPFEGIVGNTEQERFRWLDLAGARPEEVNLPIDRVVLGMLLMR